MPAYHDSVLRKPSDPEKRIRSMIVYYDDESSEEWRGDGVVRIIDTVIKKDKGQPDPVSFVTATIRIPARADTKDIA